MTQLFQNVLTASFHGSIVILAVIILRLVLKKTPKKFLCLLWLLAGIRLLMPFEIRSDLSLQPDYEPVTQVQWQQSEAYSHISEENQPVENSVEAAPAVTEAPASVSPAVPAEPVQSLPAETHPTVEVETKREIHWLSLLPWVWLAVAGCFAIYSLYSYLRLKYQVREAIKIPGGWECDRIDTAFILGFLKPRIYIPMGMPRSVRKHILAHERTHLEKGDHWFKMIGFLALAIHWFNPLVWVAYILLCKDIEMACDERVVQFMELEERKAYSAALLSCSTNRAHFAACPVAFGEVSVKYRIKSVLNYKKPSFWISLAGVIAIVFVAVCLVTSPMVKNQAADAPAQITRTDEAQETADRIQAAWDSILTADRYHLFFSDETNNGSVGWQGHFVKDGENTLWWSTDHTDEEGHMILDGTHYKFIDGTNGGWVAYDSEDDLLADMLAQFSLEDKEIRDVASEVKTNDSGYTYEKLTFTTERSGEDGSTVIQPMTVYFDTDGTMTGMRVENTDRIGADIFSFSNWSEDGMNEIDSFFENAKNKILSIEEIDPSLLADPTEDELRMKEWGILYRVDDDLLTRNGGEVWFAQSDGYNMTVHTDNEYWLEKKTENGWEKLPLLREPQWADANYTLGHGMYTMVKVDWTEFYGPLDGGTYRMGKKFEKMENGGQTCTGYAEFEIFYNASTSAEQTAAAEKCYAAVEELKNRQTIHYKVTTSSGDTEEIWWNNGDFLTDRTWPWDIYPENTDGQEPSPEEIQHVTRHTISARKDGVGYSSVHETEDEPASTLLGMQLSTLSADFAGWELSSFAENLYLYAFERSNQVIDFPADDSCITNEKISFHLYWSDPSDYETLTFWFDSSGSITKMENVSHYKDLEGYTTAFEIYDTSTAEIDAKIKPYTENLIVDTFSWEEAKAKYTDEEFNIREDSFVNNGGSPISGPVDAARLALKEYPNLGEYLSMDIFRDKTTGMWKVTIESYVDYQSTYAYRDVYLSDSGATQLLVYEGPIRFDESRK